MARIQCSRAHVSWVFGTNWFLGAVSIRKTVLLGMVIPMLKIRRPTGRLIFNMGIPIPGKTVFYIETGPWTLFNCTSCVMTAGVIILVGSLGQIQPSWWRQRWINSNTLATVPVKTVFGFPNLLSQWKHEFHLSIPVPLTLWTWCN